MDTDGFLSISESFESSESFASVFCLNTLHGCFTAHFSKPCLTPVQEVQEEIKQVTKLKVLNAGHLSHRICLCHSTRNTAWSLFIFCLQIWLLSMLNMTAFPRTSALLQSGSCHIHLVSIITNNIWYSCLPVFWPVACYSCNLKIKLLPVFSWNSCNFIQASCLLSDIIIQHL